MAGGATDSCLQVDEVMVTLVSVSVDGRVRFPSGYVHGLSLLVDTPVCAQEACVLHALRVVRKWTNGIDQSRLQYINIQAGDALTNHSASCSR